MRFAEYSVEIESGKPRQEVEDDLSKLLGLQQLLWQHQRDTGTRSYDLRSLIGDLWLIDYQDGRLKLGMRLRCDGTGSGRPEQVTAALGFTSHPTSIHRTRLILAAR
jgi:hypothetical protein